MAQPKYTLFVKYVTKLLFTDEELLTSTISGQPTPRSKSKKKEGDEQFDDDVLEPVKPNKLDPTKIQIIEGKNYVILCKTKLIRLN